MSGEQSFVPIFTAERVKARDLKIGDFFSLSLGPDYWERVGDPKRGVLSVGERAYVYAGSAHLRSAGGVPIEDTDVEVWRVRLAQPGPAQGLT